MQSVSSRIWIFDGNDPRWTVRCQVYLIHTECLILTECNSLDLPLSLGHIISFWPTRSCLIVEVLATGAKFLGPSGCCNVINCAFIFLETNVFFLFLQSSNPVLTCKAQVPKLNNVAHSFILLSNYTWSQVKHNVSSKQLPRYYQA